MSSAVLIDLANQVRRNTIRLLEEAPDSALLFAPVGTSNHIIWHAGHALWLQDRLCTGLITGEQLLDEEWNLTFGMNCRPVSETTTWPSREELLNQLTEQHQRIVAVLDDATEDDLNRVADPERGPLTVSSRIVHGFHDEAKHCGEIYLLTKMCR